MNCRPGDLAVIVKATDSYEESWVGTVVRVTHLSGLGMEGHPCWAYEGRRLIHPLYGACRGLADHALRPIRDPGDDAVDETLQWLPSPTKEIA